MTIHGIFKRDICETTHPFLDLHTQKQQQQQQQQQQQKKTDPTLTHWSTCWAEL